MPTNKTVYDTITTFIISELAKGNVPWRRSWTSQLPQNYLTKKMYRGSNFFILYLIAEMQKYSSPYWATFNQIQKVGGYVKHNQKGVKVVFWKPIDEEIVNKQGKKEIKHTFILRLHTVFNLDQCQLQEEVKKTAQPKLLEAEDIITGYKLKPKVVNAKTPYYSSKRDQIGMPSINVFDSSEEYYSTMFHEMIHSTGHATRLNRKEVCEVDYFGSENYSKEELVAEMGSAFLCAKAGISNAVIKNQAAYIKNWITALQDSRSLVIGAASRATKASDYILGINNLT